MSIPRVSICIPTYNRADMVGLAIESALKQSYRDIEVVVVDNASSDAIEEVVLSYHDPRLRFVKNEENLGLFGNFNRCIEVSRGEFLHILHSDDFIDPDFTKTCVRFFDEHPNVSLTFTSAEILTRERTMEIRYSDTDVILPAPEGFRRLLCERSFITCPSVMVRRELYERMGKYSLEFPYSSDYYQWLKIARECDIAYLRDATVYYRQGEHSESYRLLFSSPSGYLDTLKIYAQILRDLGDEYPAFATDLNCALRRFIGDCFFAGFTRADGMKCFHPSFFTGIALSAWALIFPQSIGEVARKFCDFMMVHGAGLLLCASPIRRIVKWVLYNKMQSY